MNAWDRTRRMDPYPADEPEPVAPYVADEEVVDPDARRYRTVRRVCAAINLVCGLFAVVLALHILLVLANANPRNGFASMISDWASAISLGVGTLFTPDSPKLAAFLNFGLAAVIWLLIGAALTYAIRQFALPAPRSTVRYRRTLR